MRPFLFLLPLLAAFAAFAQQAPIAIVSTSGVTTLTSSLDSAAYLAQDGDVIYLPGGTFAGQTVKHFDRRVTVIGVGHNPDSTAATGRTYINGNVGFQYGGAEGSVLDGVYVSGDVYISSQCKIYRVNSGRIMSPSGWPAAMNVVVEKCVIRNALYGSNSSVQQSVIKNCIFNSSADFVSNHYNNIFENCVFLTQGNPGIENASQCTFRYCTFTSISSWGNPSNPSNSFFYKNIFGVAGYPPIADSSNAIGNIVNQTNAGTFANPIAATYTYEYDYQLNPNSPGKGAGVNGTDIGIYGGSSPWVKGNIPPNPHIRTKNVDATTGSGGTLRVRFSVSTQ